MAKYKKGESGNPGGRPKGSRNKALTNRQLQEMLGKGDETALATIRAAMVDDKAGWNVRLKAALAWVSESAKMRAFLHKIAMEQPQEVPQVLEEEDYDTPIVSLKAVK